MSTTAISSHVVYLLPLTISALRVRKRSASNTNTISMNFDARDAGKRDEVSIRVSQAPLEKPREASGLKLDRLDWSDNELGDLVIDFEQYVVREAESDEELWAAAWLRAESQWEDRVNERYAHSYKKKFAEQVKKERGVKQSVTKSVLGTLDLSVRSLLQGETFPGERVKAPLFSINNMIEKNKYAYVCNVCVAESARRQGIASNMMHLAIVLARIIGLKEVYVHVHRKNIAAQVMYQKLGFEMVETAVSQLSTERVYLLCLKM